MIHQIILVVIKLAIMGLNKIRQAIVIIHNLIIAVAKIRLIITIQITIIPKIKIIQIQLIIKQ
jgi:hypothetical protein